MQRWAHKTKINRTENKTKLRNLKRWATQTHQTNVGYPRYSRRWYVIKGSLIVCFMNKNVYTYSLHEYTFEYAYMTWLFESGKHYYKWKILGHIISGINSWIIEMKQIDLIIITLTTINTFLFTSILSGCQQSSIITCCIYL